MAKAVALLTSAFVVACGGAGTSSTSSQVPELLKVPIPILQPVAGDIENPQAKEWTLLTKANKQWNVCATYPTMKDPYWLAADYGAVEQARRLGIKLKILDAGGYSNLSKQISDMEDCVSSGANAVLVAAISGEGVEAKVKQLTAQGIPVIETINRIGSASVTARSTLDFKRMGVASGEYLKKQVGSQPVKVAFFPGPEGAGWAERALQGFKQAISGTNIELVDTKYGDTGKDVQLRLVEDTIQAHPNLNYIVGNAVAADAAVGALQNAHLSGKIKIGSFYQTSLVRDEVQKGEVDFATNDHVVWMAAMAVDLAVRILQGENVKGDELWPTPGILTKGNLSDPNSSAGFAPSDFKPVFNV